LNLDEDFTESQLRQAYHDMVKVWHPDRFEHDERLRLIAQEKLKQINGAYEYLLARLFDENTHPSDTANSNPSSQAPEEPVPNRPQNIFRIICGILAVALMAGGIGFYIHKNRTDSVKSISTAGVQSQSTTNQLQWDILFDGSSVEHWRGFRHDNFPVQNWESRNDVLQTVDGAQSVDLITRNKYEDFELQLEWRISSGGNSGILFNVSEDVEQPWQSGPEMQLLDDEKHPDGRNPKTSAGSLFGVIAPQNKHLNPAGEWNQTRIVVSKCHVEYWLNGSKVVEYELGSDTFKSLVKDSQFANQPSYASQKTGHIVLQSYKSQVGFRNIRIRRLSSQSLSVTQ